VARLLREHPGVHLSVAKDNWANLFPLLRKRDLDLAVIDVTAAEDDPEMKVIKLLNHQGYFVLRAQHPLLEAQRSRPLEATWNYPFVSTARFPTAVFKELAGRLLGSKKATIFGGKALLSVACESLYMMKIIATESDAVTVLPLHLVIDEVERGELVAIPAPDWFRGNFGIAYLAHRSLSPLGETFVRMVHQADAELLEWEHKTARRLFKTKEPRNGKSAPVGV
jgi:DNA-binding transcriptional LysR family regulator